MIKSFEAWINGPRSRVQGLESRSSGPGPGVSKLEYRAKCFQATIKKLGSHSSGLGSVPGLCARLGARVSDLGSRV
eukprot:1548911-Rhodomonas_salina.2